MPDLDWTRFRFRILDRNVKLRLITRNSIFWFDDRNCFVAVASITVGTSLVVYLTKHEMPRSQSKRLREARKARGGICLAFRCQNPGNFDTDVSTWTYREIWFKKQPLPLVRYLDFVYTDIVVLLSDDGTVHYYPRQTPAIHMATTSCRLDKTNLCEDCGGQLYAELSLSFCRRPGPAKTFPTALHSRVRVKRLPNLRLEQ